MPTLKDLPDLGLTYEQATHGVQSAIGHSIEAGAGKNATDPKHVRVGIDMSKADMLGLALLLMEKGVFTQAEYIEAMRRAANAELDMHESEANKRQGGGVKLTFR